MESQTVAKQDERESKLKELQLILDARLKEIEVKEAIFKENLDIHEKRIALQSKESEERRKELQERERIVVEKEEQLMERERMIAEKQKELDVKLGKWEEVEENMEINSSKLGSVVHLNVGM